MVLNYKIIDKIEWYTIFSMHCIVNGINKDRYLSRDDSKTNSHMRHKQKFYYYYYFYIAIWRWINCSWMLLPLLKANIWIMTMCEWLLLCLREVSTRRLFGWYIKYTRVRRVEVNKLPVSVVLRAGQFKVASKKN